MRAIIFDTETTGLDPASGDRVIELAGVELENDVPTGAVIHHLFNPGRDISEAATRVHGYTAADLADKPSFKEVASEIRNFFGTAKCVAHNADFDYAFLNSEFAIANVPLLERDLVIDTLALAKTLYPGLPNSLDALCRRFGIDASRRTKHSALLDCELLTQVYIELIGGRQRGFTLDSAAATRSVSYHFTDTYQFPEMPVDALELADHASLLAKIKNPIWNLDEGSAQ